ncbi:MAG: hypothetical protein FRX49_03213 [Trebouxia sp. A1-2]|nr:MAG: hypothetical protein FRX49_03213 [Trebouxia sp. A1-2]
MTYTSLAHTIICRVNGHSSSALHGQAKLTWILGVLQRHVRVSNKATLLKNMSCLLSQPPKVARWRSSGRARVVWPYRGLGASPSTSDVCSVHFHASVFKVRDEPQRSPGPASPLLQSLSKARHEKDASVNTASHSHRCLGLRRRLTLSFLRQRPPLSSSQSVLWRRPIFFSYIRVGCRGREWSFAASMGGSYLVTSQYAGSNGH